MWSFLFIALAAACNAVMDSVSHHYSQSIFAKLPNKQWWDGRDSWLNKYVDRDVSKGRTKVPVQLTDAWHFFKMLMIVFICTAIVTYNPKETFLMDILCFGFLGITWNFTFSLIYKL